MFFWELFCFRNERNILPFILLPIAECTEWKECGLIGIDKIRVLWEIFGGKSYAATDIVVLRSPPIPFPELKHKEGPFRK